MKKKGKYLGFKQLQFALHYSAAMDCRRRALNSKERKLSHTIMLACITHSGGSMPRQIISRARHLHSAVLPLMYDTRFSTTRPFLDKRQPSLDLQNTFYTNSN